MRGRRDRCIFIELPSKEWPVTVAGYTIDVPHHGFADLLNDDDHVLRGRCGRAQQAVWERALSPSS